MDPATSVVSAKPLDHDAVFRIEVSLSSRKSSAIVMRTTARLYSLEGTQGLVHMGAAADAEWKSVAYGAPCIQLMKETTDHNSPFKVKIVIAEVESGIALWEEEVGPESKYHAMQSNFHTFVTKGHTFAIQFANEDEGSRMLESLQDLFMQKQKSETVSFDKKPDDSTVFKKPKSTRRLNKKDISAPCNFKHVSGITMQRTQICEEELRGTIQRKIRSMSLSSLTRNKPRSHLHGDMVDGMYRHSSIDTPDLQRRMEAETEKGSKLGSVLHKFGSLRKSWKKAPSKSSPPDLKEQHNFVRDTNRMSLPSHFRRQVRPGLSSDTFSHPGMDPHGLNKAISLSSGDLLDLPSDSAQLPHKSAPIKRRHTMVLLDGSPTRRPDNQQFNYTPYRAQNPRFTSSLHHQPRSQGGLSSTRPYMSDMSLHQNPQAYNFNRAQERRIVDARMYQAAQERQRRVTPDQFPTHTFRRPSLTEAQVEGRISFDERRPHMQARTSNGMIHHQVIREGHVGFISSAPNGRIAPGAVPHGRGDARMPLQGSEPHYATIGSPTRHTLSTQPIQSKSMVPGPDFHYDALSPRNRPLPPTPLEVQIPRPQLQEPLNYNPVNPRPSFNAYPGQHYTQQHPQGFSHASSQHVSTRPPQASAEQYHSQVSPSHSHSQVSPSHRPTRFPPSFQPISNQMPQHSQKQYLPAQYHHPAQWQPSYPAQMPVQRTGGYPPHQQQQTGLNAHHSTATPNDTNSYYDLLNPQNPTVGVAGSRDSTATQGSDPELAEMTEEVTQQMSRVLEQFDSLLPPREPSRPIMQQTAL